MLNGKKRNIRRTQVLGLHSLGLRDFASTEEAFQVADTLIADNASEFGHEIQQCRHVSGVALLDRFFYVQGHGKKKTWATKEEQKLELGGEVTNKNDLAKVTSALEILGPMAKCTGEVKLENPAWADLGQKIANLRKQNRIEKIQARVPPA